MGQYAAHEGELDASGRRVAVVAGRFNRDIVQLLHDGAVKQFEQLGVAPVDIDSFWVPGAFELPLLAKELASTGRYDAVVCVGAVVRGGTPHFEYVAGESARGLMDAQLATGVPIIFGVLTTDDREQAFDRAGGAEGNKGEEAATTAVEMIAMLQVVRDQRGEG